MNLKAPRLEEGFIKVFQYADHEYSNEKPQFCGDQKFFINYVLIYAVKLAIDIAIAIAVHVRMLTNTITENF